MANSFTRGRILCAVLALAVLGSMPVGGRAALAAPRSTLRLAALDDGAAVLPDVMVTAMAFGPDGTIYAGGRTMVKNTSPLAVEPASPGASVWLTSHDNGATWTRYAGTPDFTPNSLTLDPRNPRVLYTAGCTHGGAFCIGAGGGHEIMRSTDGGRTWHDIFSFRAPGGTVPTPANVSTNIDKTRALFTALQYGGTSPLQAYAVAVDPRVPGRLYAAMAGLGVLRSDNAGRTWHYSPQPLLSWDGAQFLFDGRMIYILDRSGRLVRSDDGGARWNLRYDFYAHVDLQGGGVSSLIRAAGMLYVTAARGIYRSANGGATWHIVYHVPTGVFSVASAQAMAVWLVAADSKQGPAYHGLYVVGPGGWSLAANASTRGPQHAGALDDQAIFAEHVTRLWMTTPHLVFTVGPEGGLYRWVTSM